MTKTIPARVKALALQIGDEPIDWNERKDGSIVIVFCNKGKQTFLPETVLPAADNEQEAESRTPAPDPATLKTPKRKEKK